MSEKTLDNLIITLKSEAIEAAEKEAGAIIRAAQERAEGILQDARKEQQQLLENAQKEAQATLDKGESALRQAARDVTVTLHNDIVQLLKAVLEKEIDKNFTPELLRSAIVEVVTNIGGTTTLKLAPDFKEEVLAYLLQRIQTLGKPIAISNDTNLLKGFSIVEKDQGWRYDVSPEAVTEILYGQLGSSWISILKTELKK